MGIYKVQSNGKAPRGLALGDQVVTGAGTYIITGVHEDGSYSSMMYNAAQNTGNYRGYYDTPGSSDNPSVYNHVVNGGSVEDYYLQMLDRTLSSGHTSQSSNATAGSSSSTTPVMSFSQAVELAGQTLKPQYQAAYQQAASQSQQRLERAGLYDTLYGQALAAAAQNQVTEALNSAIAQLALELSSDSQSNAYKQAQLAADEQQYSAKLNAQQQSTVLEYLLKLMQLQQKQQQQDFNMAQQELKTAG